MSYSGSLGLKAFHSFLFKTHYSFQVMLSIFMVPYSLYLSLVYWIYPMKDYIGDTGCYMFVYGRDIGGFIIELHSFFIATFRYVCLFHDNFLLRFNLTPHVSNYVFERRSIFSTGPMKMFFNLSKNLHNFYL